MISFYKEHGDSLQASPNEQASWLCSIPTTVYTTQHDIWMSHCNEYLQTANLPATTLPTTSPMEASQMVDRGAVKPQVSRVMGQCGRQGDFKHVVTSTSTTMASGSGPANGGGGRRMGKEELL